jgi:hypothetical protein
MHTSMHVSHFINGQLLTARVNSAVHLLHEATSVAAPAGQVVTYASDAPKEMDAPETAGGDGARGC